MARYIDADKAKHEFNIGFGGVSHAVIANQIIDSVPTADVAEVVRCKDCQRFVENKEAFVTYCTRELKNLYVKPTDFCSYGTPKERGGEK